MACSIHPNRDHAGLCNTCGRALCDTCIRQYDPPMCAYCAVEIGKKANHKLAMNVVLSTVFSITGFVVALQYGGVVWLSVFIAVFIGSLPWGWTATSKISKKSFERFGFLGRMGYFAVKTIASAVIGVFAIPFQIIKLSNQIVLSKMANIQLQANQCL